VQRRDAIDLVATVADLFETGRWPGRTWVRIGRSLALDLSAEFAKPAQLEILVLSRSTHGP